MDDATLMPVPILFQHEDFIIVNKPAGVLVHSHPRFPKEIPVLQRIRNQMGKQVWLAHRLDRQTSGCLLIALRKESIFYLAEALRQGQKTYWAGVRGYFPCWDQITVDSPIKSERGSQSAQSIVRCLGRSTEPRCSLLEVNPLTGRNRQVRRHVRDLDHPILHDGDHGDSRVNRHWRENHGLKRLALHAGIIHVQIQNRIITVHCPLPEDLQSVFTQLPWWQEAIDNQPLLCAATNSSTIQIPKSNN